MGGASGVEAPWLHFVEKGQFGLAFGFGMVLLMQMKGHLKAAVSLVVGAPVR